jgi:predicted transcriptional regulator
VITTDGKLVGVLKLHGLLTLILPAFTILMEDFDFVGDFGAMESIQPSQEIISKQVSDVMEAPVYVYVSSGLSRAFSLLHHHNLTDLPVVDSDKHLIGIASRVDIGTAILKNWEIVSGD